MYDYLIDHAIKNVWCNPSQDRQSIIKPHRLSIKSGAINVVDIINRKIYLPSNNEYYHIFQIGQLNPYFLGLLDNDQEWTSEKWNNFITVCSNQKLIINVYNEAGINIPLIDCYYILTEEKTLLLAVRENKKININYHTETIYFRFYSNAFFESIRSNNPNDYINIISKKYATIDDISFMTDRINYYNGLDGYCFCYVNGYLVNNISLTNAKTGDTLEIVFDGSVKKVANINLNNSPVFTSIIDGVRKYVIHYANDSENIINYFDDIDFYIVDYKSDTVFKGLYYHKNSIKNTRMLTHQDYSIVVSNVSYIANVLNNSNNKNIYVKLIIRNSGYDRPLIHESSKIHELYKLDNKIINSMFGPDSTLDVWKAENLENSYYSKLMSANAKNINRALVENAYGYNSISELLGSTPKKTFISSNKQQINLNYGQYENSTAYEYDSDGLLLETHHHLNGSVYSSVNPNCRSVEVICGLGTHTPDVRFGTDNILLPNNDNYRVYLSHIVNDEYDENWTDITGTDLYHVSNSRIIYDNLDPNRFLMVRTDNTFLSYDIYLIPSDGIIRFTLSEIENRYGEIIPNDVIDPFKHYKLPVPMGELDLFMNGYSLIENIDYVYNFPDIIIINKKYLTTSPNISEQWIHIRYTGFCNSDLSRNVQDDYGFIEHGFLSNNNRFDLRDDRVLRIVVAGKLKHKSDLLFSEEHSGVSINNVNNGSPYLVKDIIVPFRSFTDRKTYDLYNQAEIINKSISDYLTLMLPQPSRNAPSAIVERYPVVSPFICKILYDLYTETITTESIKKITNLDDVKKICEPYLDWLEFDLLSKNYNTGYVILHPVNHDNTMMLNLLQYRFLQNVVTIYGKGLIELSPFVELKPLSIPYTPIISGPSITYLSALTSHVITNYESNRVYTLTAISGSVERIDNVILYTAPDNVPVDGVGFILSGIRFELEYLIP